jgi:putative membrane protein
MKSVHPRGKVRARRFLTKGSQHMKRMIQGVLLASTLVLGGSALAQQGTQEHGKGAMAKGGTAEHRGFMVPTDERAFLERLHYSNQMEIKLSQLAQQNASNPDVKSFAEQMVREHTAADQRLMSMAQGRGMKLSDTPKPMNDLEKRAIAADKADLEKLQALKGEAFDSCYMANQVGQHDETLGKLMAARQALGGNAELTRMVNELTPHMAQHRQQAYSILGKLGPQSMGIGGAGSDMGQQGHRGGQGHMGGQQGTGGRSGSTSGSGQQQQH